MAPKKANIVTSDDEPSLSDIVKILKSQGEQLAAISAQTAKVEKLESDMCDLKIHIVALREENKELKGQLKEKDKLLDDMSKSVNGLEERLNNLEQHHRSWGARVLNVPVSDSEAADPRVMVNKVFDLALRPILEGAVAAGRLADVPLATSVLEVAHVLPGKPGQPRPIIMRFYNRNIRSLCFQFKRDHAPREPAKEGRNNQEDVNRLGRFAYPIYDDLTRATLHKMRAIQQDERVMACWTVNGRIHFKLHNSESVKKVVSIQDPLDVILRS
jgi:hypothetical protein